MNVLLNSYTFAFSKANANKSFFFLTLLANDLLKV